MIPTPDNREQLLAETYHGDWNTGDSARFATRAAAHARRHRALMRTVKGTAATALMLAAIFAITSHRKPTHSTVATPDPVRTTTTYEIISDAELLALVQDRPLLLVQNSGSQPRIVTFDN